MRPLAPLLVAVALLGAPHLAAASGHDGKKSGTPPAPVSGSTGTPTGSVGTAGPLGPYTGPNTRTWTACGGPTPTTLLCAEAWVGVTGLTTTVRVRNLSGVDGLALPAGADTDGRWVLTTIGFDGLPSYVAALFAYDTDGSWWRSSSRSAEPRAWSAFNDGQYGGGERIDVGIDNGAGISGGIASSCAPLGTLPGGSNRLWMTPNPGCAAYGAGVVDAASTPWFEARFVTTAPWDPNEDPIAFYFKGQNGPGGASWECLVGGVRPRGDCIDLVGGDAAGDGSYPGSHPPIGATVPEPGTIVLVATGLAGVALAGRRRRRTAPLTAPVAAPGPSHDA